MDTSHFLRQLIFYFKISVRGKKLSKGAWHLLITFCGKPKEFEEFFNQIVEALGITTDRRPKGRPHKMEK